MLDRFFKKESLISVLGMGGGGSGFIIGGASGPKAIDATGGSTFFQPAPNGPGGDTRYYKIHAFNNNSSTETFSVASNTKDATNYPSTVEYYLIAGGGGAGSAQDSPSGGGAGGFLPGSFTASIADYTMRVGAGGNTNANGTPSYISGPAITTVTAYGGGKGGGPANTPGTPGGSGGGGSGDDGSASGGTGNKQTGTNNPTGTPSQGTPGGSGGGTVGGGDNGGGGGGGATAQGANGQSGGPGSPGGAGAAITWGLPTSYGTTGPNGSARYFSGGGAGSGHSGPAASANGGVGGGGGVGPNGQGNGGFGPGAKPAASYPTSGGGGGGGPGAPGSIYLRYLYDKSE